MDFTFICLVIAHYTLLLGVHAKYNKNVECIVGKDHFPICKTIKPNITESVHSNIPSYEPYIPRRKSVFYYCSNIECKPYSLVSLTQLTHPTPKLKYCYLQATNDYACESVKYNFYKNIDKLLFLANNIPTNKFFLADCLLYSDGERVCHEKDIVNSHVELIDIGNIARPNENNILSQDELICEMADNTVKCDFNLYVPYATGLKRKEPMKHTEKILLKTGSRVTILKPLCKSSWCGYGGGAARARRSMARERYAPAGGSVYRCYYANKQQICKKLYDSAREVYNERDWIRTGK